MDTFNSGRQSKMVILGCFDSKSEEFEYLYSCLKELNVEVFTINTGVRSTEVNFHIDVSAEEVAKAAGYELSTISKLIQRGEILEIMGLGAQEIVSELKDKINILGAIGMGGGGGTYLTIMAMQALPFGIPKICISTVATKDLSRQIGAKDIVMIPSIVDLAGLNSISRKVISQAASAILGMANAKQPKEAYTKKTIAISMFGNTTECVNYCSDLLKAKGYEVLCFHAVGSGGRTMEALIEDGLIDAVLDITITELADELCGGICSAGPERLETAGKVGIPQVVVPGCLDMVNFAQLDTVPKKYADRLLFNWAPDVTLMRTDKAENIALGSLIASKLNRSKGKATILLPLKGISIVSSEGNLFYAPETDKALFDTIKSKVNNNITIREVNFNINDIAFAKEAVDSILELI
ncbi:Tm-1-like ATP-binding domain-containing protein [Portibacter lacus]|uniref:Uncharacterized protein n=1 Tax=Portibacter lacus TaxID=1099794 RepID=A0AA37WGK7_9BACT|nr:Tm-1-like ATP-binding domain-containing protein [Portibacter lacus]GLR18434.1 hypothetical protein GCM10007940_30500 [Portibacter lacus]